MPRVRYPRVFRPLTAERLENAALAYLARHQSSAANLSRVLLRRVERAARTGQVERAAAARWVERLVERYARAGLVDDKAYAEARVASLRRAGASARAIRGRLLGKGVSRPLIEAALQDQAEGGDAEFDAAIALARRRRLGPFRHGRETEALRARDLAALARAGFSYETARAIIDARNPADLARRDRDR
jgi:regulatory protein